MELVMKVVVMELVVMVTVGILKVLLAVMYVVGVNSGGRCWY